MKSNIVITTYLSNPRGVSKFLVFESFFLVWISFFFLFSFLAQLRFFSCDRESLIKKKVPE